MEISRVVLLVKTFTPLRAGSDEVCVQEYCPYPSECKQLATGCGGLSLLLERRFVVCSQPESLCRAILTAFERDQQ